MQLASRDLSSYQRSLIDVYLVLILAAILPLILTYLCLKKCWKCKTRLRSTDSKKNKWTDLAFERLMWQRIKGSVEVYAVHTQNLVKVSTYVVCLAFTLSIENGETPLPLCSVTFILSFTYKIICGNFNTKSWCHVVWSNWNIPNVDIHLIQWK